MPFEVLGEDILLSILCFCDVCTVLAVSATNKPLRRVTLSKQLWLSLVQDSSFRTALELPPPDREEIENYSTEELIGFVKSAVGGPGPFDCPSATITYTNYKIPLPPLENNPDAQLLPGARYILLQNTNWQELYIYDVWSARRIWQRTVQIGTICKVDLVPGGAIARVLLAQPFPYPNKKLHIEEVDLITGLSHQVFELGVATERLVISRYAKYVISGDFFLCTMLHSLVYDAKYTLVNWRTSTFVDRGNGPNYAVKLIPGYIVLTDLEYYPSQQQVLTVTALEQFSEGWQPLSDAGLAAAQLRARDPPIPNIVRERLAYNNQPLGWHSVDVDLAVTPSALCRGAYNISVKAGELPGPPTLIEKIGNLVPARRRRLRPPVHEVLLSYKFIPTPSHGRACELRLVSAQRVSSTTQTSSPRALVQWSGDSIIVSYRQPEWPPTQGHAK
ncbi:hypothetical protein MSAN_00957800 [Mycena sanguinolenta]|uniref:F-box domain-containing protein n=1 Tax=Mycena sanguinolenta TaxID=230812 RepID=A0A8H6YTQ0_9AGAR|nr:hypothetical protein MSAN_00957800 [Mycena sanguinolenta]